VLRRFVDRRRARLGNAALQQTLQLFQRQGHQLARAHSARQQLHDQSQLGQVFGLIEALSARTALGQGKLVTQLPLAQHFA